MKQFIRKNLPFRHRVLPINFNRNPSRGAKLIIIKFSVADIYEGKSPLVTKKNYRTSFYNHCVHICL